MIKISLLALLFFTNVMALDASFSGVANYTKTSFFGTKHKDYLMSISFSKQGVILSLPEYDCTTQLILESQNSNVYTYLEKHLSGSCKVDPQATTQIRIREDEIDYLWQNDNESMIGTLKKI
jgi:hypothetical protein